MVVKHSFVEFANCTIAKWISNCTILNLHNWLKLTRFELFDNETSLNYEALAIRYYNYWTDTCTVHTFTQRTRTRKSRCFLPRHYAFNSRALPRQILRLYRILLFFNSKIVNTVNKQKDSPHVGTTACSSSINRWVEFLENHTCSLKLNFWWVGQPKNYLKNRISLFLRFNSVQLTWILLLTKSKVNSLVKGCNKSTKIKLRIYFF